MLRNRIELVQSTGHSSVTRSLQFQVLRAAQADGFLFHLLPQLTKKKNVYHPSYCGYHHYGQLYKSKLILNSI